MRFDPGETGDERWERLSKWHRVFAIWPRKLAPHDWRFLEYVERRTTRTDRVLFFWYVHEWEYREFSWKTWFQRKCDGEAEE